MGGLRKYMPITYITVLIGALASAGVPGFAGFFSKDSIIEAVHLSRTPGAGFAYFCVVACVFVTAFYTFRLVFMTFHGKERFREQHADDHHGDAHGHDDHGGQVHEPHESPAVVTIPLIALAIPSVCAGWFIGTVLFGGYFDGTIFVSSGRDVVGEMAHDFHGVVGMMTHALGTLPFWLSTGGIAVAAYLYLVRPDLPPVIYKRAGILSWILERKYGFDELYSWLFAGGARLLGKGLWRVGDVAIIDGLMVNGSARLVGWFSGVIRGLQSGFIYHYAIAMILGILLLMTMIFVS